MGRHDGPKDGLPVNGINVLTKDTQRDAWVIRLVEHLPLALAVIPQSWDRVLHGDPCSVKNRLLALPLPLRTCARALFSPSRDK